MLTYVFVFSISKQQCVKFVQRSLDVVEFSQGMFLFNKATNRSVNRHKLQFHTTVSERRAYASNTSPTSAMFRTAMIELLLVINECVVHNMFLAYSRLRIGFSM